MDAHPVPRAAWWRAPVGHVRRVLAGVPLRFRLIGAVLLLVAVALVGSGAAATATLRNYLVGKVDQQLSGVAQRAHDLGDLAAAGGGPPSETGHQRLPSDFVTEVLGATGKPIAPMDSYLVGNEPLPAFPRITAKQSLADGPRYFVVGAKSGGQQWRVYAYPVQFVAGQRGTVLISQSLGGVDTTIGHLVGLLFVIGAVAVVVVAGAGYLIVRANLRPLHAVETAAAQIAGGDLAHRVPQPDPRTEVGHLASALNTMLGRIETAFTERAESERAARESSERAHRSEAAARQSEERMRRFVADASHELRTPLTTVRGFAELYRQGAVAEGQDTRQLLGRIESEAQRMGVLVEDLLMLARLDEERPLAREPVDVLTIASDAAHTAQALAPDRAIRLNVGTIDPPPIVIGDDVRLRQVIGNLLTNAVKYSPAGTPVTIGVSTGPGTRSHAPTVTVTVTDQGPGLAPDDAARVFERFYRADRARNRNDGGAGLGLAIVAAIVAGHGGQVSVDTAPGEGATFRVELPSTG